MLPNPLALNFGLPNPRVPNPCLPAPCLLTARPPAALEEAAALVNEGDLLVTALSLGFATTALREQPTCAATVCDKARWVGGWVGGVVGCGGWGGAGGGGARRSRACCPEPLQWM